MADHRDPKHVDEVTGIATTGHEWDGIRELDNPLPRWWLYIFYASILISAVYWVLMPAWPLANGYTKGLRNHSDRVNVAADVGALRAGRAEEFAKLSQVSLDQIEGDPQLLAFAQAAGRSAFGDNCATCHGQGAQGGPGYPSLQDDVWIWGGSASAIEHTLKVGIRAEHPETRFSQMPAFGRDGLLPDRDIDALTEHVLTLSGAQANAGLAARGAGLFATHCASCHGAAGAGDRAQGAPALTDQIWLYGGSREEIRTQIVNGRGGVMPSWSGRLDEGVIRALAVYVHSLGGGEPEPAPPAPAPVDAAAMPAAPT